MINTHLPIIIFFSISLFSFLEHNQKEPKVLKVSTKESSGKYTFSVTIESPDKGCQQYADWWEVLDEKGNLLYRRVLGHSHVDEQPFTRSGGPVMVKENAVVIIRMHMNSSGNSSLGMKGSIEMGFKPFHIPKGFAAEVEKQKPLPTGCAF